MSVFVKHKLFSFHNDTIRNISIQREGSVMALSGGLESDTLKILEMKIASEYPSSSVTEKINFAPINLTTNSKDSIYLMKWSPNDQFLATGCVKVKVWRFTNKNLFLHKDFTDHSLEITALSWSPDSTQLASSSLASKIVIRNIEKEGVKDIHLGSKVLGLVWDPLDKYLSCLTADNNIIIFKTNTWEQIKSVSLSLSANMVLSTCKRDFKGRSPDFKYILSPSLDDKIVPMVCALDRQEFKVTHTFMGPFSSINCVKFNPHLFKYEGITASIFAMGDNDGNISVWGLSEKLVMNKPFFLFKSHYNGTELIEDLCWNGEGNLLIASTLKKYISLILFDDKVFGEKLKPIENQRHLEELYGVKNLISKTQTFKIFNPNLVSKDAGSANYASYMGLANKEGHGAEQGEGMSEFNSKPEVKYVFTTQKTIVENGKKRIIPQMQKIVTEEAKNNYEKPETAKPNDKSKANEGRILLDLETEHEEKNLKKTKSAEPQDGNEGFINKVHDVLDLSKGSLKESKVDKKPQLDAGTPSVNQSNSNLSLKKKSPAVKETKKPGGNMTLENKHASSNVRADSILFHQPQPISGNFIYKYLSGKILELEVKSNNGKFITKVKCSIMKNNQKEILWSDFYEGKVIFLEFNENLIATYTTESLLYLSSSKGRRLEIPLVISNLGYLRLNKNDDILFVKTTGELRVMNLKTKAAMIDENIRFIYSENAKDPKLASQQQDIIENIVLDNFGIPIILFKNKSLYFYSQDHRSWQKTDFSEFELGYLQSISQYDFEIKNIVQTKQIEKIDKFFDKLFVEQDETMKIENENEMKTIPFLEEKLIFFMSKNDPNKFLEIAQKYIDKLAQLKEINKLRQFLVDIIVETSTKEAQFLTNNQINRPELSKKLLRSLAKYNYLNPFISELEAFFSTCI